GVAHRLPGPGNFQPDAGGVWPAGRLCGVSRAAAHARDGAGVDRPRDGGDSGAARPAASYRLDSPEDSEDILRTFDFEQLECDECAAHLTAVRPERHGDFADGPFRAQPLEQCRVFIPLAPEPEG